MRKNAKKVISVLIAAFMIMSLMGTFAYTGTQSWSVDFTNAVANTAPAGSGLVYGNIYPEEGIHSALPVAGKAMKDKNDIALRVSSKEGVYPDTLLAKANFTNPNVNKDLDVASLVAGDIVHISLEMLNEDFYTTKSVIMKANSELSTNPATKYDRQDPNAPLVEMGGSGVIKMLGFTVPSTYSLGQWYKFDIFLNGYGNTADLYLNGKLIKAGQVYQPKGGQADSVLTAVRLVRPNYTVPLKAGTAKEYWPTAMCIDNMQVEVLSAIPTMTETNLNAIADFSYVTNVPTQKYYSPTTTAFTIASADFDYGNWKNPTLNTNTGTGVMNFSVEKGKLGKSASDASLHIYNPQQYFDPDATNNTNGYFSIAPKAAGTVSAAAIAPGDKFRLSTSFALDTVSNSTKGFSTVFNGAVPADRPTITSAIDISADGTTVKVFGTTLTGVKLRLGTWYKFDLVCTAGDGTISNTADLYINGELKTTAPVAFDATKVAKSAVTSCVFRPGFTATKTTGTANTTLVPGKTVYEYKADGFYIDDVYFSVYRGGAGMSNPVCKLSSSDSAINSLIKNGIISPTPYNLTVENFLATASATNSNDLYVMDETGAKVTTGTLLGKKVVVVPLYGGEIYYNVIERDIVFSTDFNYALANNTKPTGITGYSKFYDGTYFPWHTSYGQTAVGGKSDTDSAFFIKTQNFDNVKPVITPTPSPDPYATAISDPFIDYAASMDYTETVTYEVAMLAEGNNHDNAFSVGINGTATTNLKEMVNMKASGDITLNGAPTAKWVSGRWYKFGVTLYYGTNKADFYINGKRVLQDVVLSNLKDASGNNTTTMTSFRRMKLNVTYGTPPAGQTYTGALGLDNLKFYTGGYRPDEISFTMSNATVNNTTKKIYMAEPTEYSTFVGYIASDVAPEIYTDNTLATPYSDPEVVGGAIVVFRSVNGEVIEYYEVVDASSVVGIISSDYTVTETTSTISGIPKGTSVSVLKSKFVTEMNNTMTVLDSQNNSVADSAIVIDGMKLKIASQNGSAEKIYTLDVLDATAETFESWPVKQYDKLNFNAAPIPPAPWTMGGFPEAETARQTITDGEGNVTEVYPSAYIETITDSERNGKVLHFWSKSNTPNDISTGFRHINVLKTFNQTEANDVFMVDVAIKADDAYANTSVTTKYIPTEGAEAFMEIITLGTNQSMMFFSTKIGTYEIGKWHRYTALVDVKQHKADLYLDGVKIVSEASIASNIKYFTQIRLQQQFCYQTVRNTYFDDFKFEKLYSSASFDANPITTQLTSGVYTVKPGYIKGIGTNVTASALKSALVKPNGDVTLGIYMADKTTPVADSTVVTEGMNVKVVSADGLSVSYYKLSNTPDIGSIVTKIDGTDTNVIANGAFTAQADAGLYGQTAAIVIARYEGGKLVEMATNSITESGTLLASMTITNAENSTVKVMVVDSLQNIKPYIAAKQMNP